MQYKAIQPLETGFLRLNQITGNLKAKPPIEPLIPIGKSTLWLWVKEGKFPPPIKLGSNTTVWYKQDVLDFIQHGEYRENRVNQKKGEVMS